jgi:hypothetical protein
MFKEQKHITGAWWPLGAIIGSCDSDFAGDVKTRRSTSGYLIYAFGALVNWSSKRQLSIVTSSHESEYIGQSQACKNVKWVAMLLRADSRPKGGANSNDIWR